MKTILTASLLLLDAVAWSQIGPCMPGGMPSYLAPPQSGATAFDPSTLSGYALDYDVDTLGLPNGNTIATLTDKGPNHFHLLSAGSAAPYWTNNASYANGKGCVHFNGTTMWMQTNFTTTFAQNNTLFIVLHSAYNPPNQGFLFSCGSDGAALEAMYTTGSGQGLIQIYAGTGVATPVSYFQLTNTFMLQEFHFKGASSTWLTNGVQAWTGNPGTVGLKGFSLCNRFASSTWWYNADVARVILCNSDVTGGDSGSGLAGVRHYLNTNYNLGLGL